jgi:regulatory protein
MSRNIMEAAASKLAMRSMTVTELRRYLLDKGYSPQETEQVLKSFLEDGYLDDARYCRGYFEYAFSRNKGKARVFAELRKKGVESQVMEFAYEDYLAEEDVKISEYDMAMRETEKILRLADLTLEDPVPEKVRGRVARKLHSYGYSTSLIYEILDKLK